MRHAAMQNMVRSSSSTSATAVTKRAIKLMNLPEVCTKEDVVGVMLAMVGLRILPQDVILSDVSSGTRQRKALVRFSRFADYKLALQMLKICNRTDEAAAARAAARTAGDSAGKTDAALDGDGASFVWPRSLLEDPVASGAFGCLLEGGEDAFFIPLLPPPKSKIRVPSNLLRAV